MNDLFNNPDQGQEQEPANYLEALVGEGKKFKDLEALARGKWESDRMITHKNREFDQLREDYLKKDEELKTRARLEELVERLSNPQQSLREEPNPEDNKPDLSKALEDFKKNLPSEFEKYEQEKKQRENFNSVQNKLKEQYGDNYANVLKQKIQELDLDSDYVNSLARKSPKAFFNTLGLTQNQRGETFQSPPRSVQSDSFAPGTKKRTWSFYEKLKAENPREYLSPKIQTQMLQDMKDLGDQFKDGSWNNI